MSKRFATKINCTLFGQSHSECVGAVIEGLPPGFVPNLDAAHRFMQRRAPGTSAFSTARREPDRAEIISGLADGKCCGAPLCVIIRNTDTRSVDYESLRRLPRPGHADYPAYVKYADSFDIRGGGQFSGRMTAPLCFAGALCIQLLAARGIHVAAHIAEIDGMCDSTPDPAFPDENSLLAVRDKQFPVLCDRRGVEMLAHIEAARAAGDSVGGVVECFVLGLSAGVGGPLDDGLESALAAAVFAIPAVKGVEFGAGFAVSRMRGSEANDPFALRDGKIVTETNNCGGILGGISTAMPIVLRAAFKPTPSISRPQKTINLDTLTQETLEIKGRHDPCVVPRALVALEAAVALTLAEMIITQ